MMRAPYLFCSPGKAGVQPATNIARGSVQIGATRRVWAPAFAAERGGDDG